MNAFLVVGGLLGAGVSLNFWGVQGAAASLGVILCLALGFWLTEMLVGVFTRVKTANPTAIALLFLGKLGWWAALFAGARYLPKGLDGAVGLGIGVFLVALLLSSIRHYGMPRISDGNPPNSP